MDRRYHYHCLGSDNMDRRYHYHCLGSGNMDRRYHYHCLGSDNMDRSQWKPGQPDNWKGHGLGGTEDCAMIHANGQLNDDHCSRSYRYVCQGHTLTHTH
nr:C-type lectin domain family 10 member A-like [Salvelinus alpinus]